MNYNRFSRIFAAAAAVVFICLIFTHTVNAEPSYPYNASVSVNGSEAATVRRIDNAYVGNAYLSLRDLASLFSTTDKAFRLSVADSSIRIAFLDFETDQTYETDDGYQALNGWSEEEIAGFKYYSLGSNSITVNDENRKYYTVIGVYSEKQDCFINVTDFAMLLDVNVTMDEGGAIYFDTGSRFMVNPAKLENDGVFQSVNGIIVGDATTGEIYYSYYGDSVRPIASTTKLMTYLLTMDAISSGGIKSDDLVTVSSEADRLSKSGDGTIPMKTGSEVLVSDLIMGALLPSSNECAYLLAEHIAGSEPEFVSRMNSKARELNMNTAEFYNSNGLPTFTNTAIAAKKQNRMSCNDLFRLSSHIVNTYPDYKDVTSVKYAALASLGNAEVKNTNPLLYNMSEVTGLKTGTTDSSGACLVTSLEVNDGTQTHTLISIVLGAENSLYRGRISELMSRYAKAVVLGQADRLTDANINDNNESKAVTANDIVNRILENASRINKQ